MNESWTKMKLHIISSVNEVPPRLEGKEKKNKWNNRRTEEHCKLNNIKYFTNEWLLVIPIPITQILNINFNFIHTFCADWFFDCSLYAIWLAYTFFEVEKLRLSTIEMNVYNINIPNNSCSSIKLYQMAIFLQFLLFLHFPRFKEGINFRTYIFKFLFYIYFFFLQFFSCCISLTVNRNDTVNVCR